MFTHPRMLIDVKVMEFLTYLNRAYLKSHCTLGNSGVRIVVSDRLYRLVMDDLGEDGDRMLTIPAAATLTLPSDSCTGHTTVCLMNSATPAYQYLDAVLAHELGHVVLHHPEKYIRTNRDLLQIDQAADEYATRAVGLRRVMSWLEDLQCHIGQTVPQVEQRFLTLHETIFV